MKKLLCLLILLKVFLTTWPVMADASINGRWLDYYEEGDSVRVDKGVSVTTRTANERAGAYLKTGLWRWDLSNSVITFRVKVSNWRDVHTMIFVVGSSGLKFEKSATFNIKQRIIGASNNEWVEISIPQSAWIIDGDVDWANINSILFAVADLGYQRITAEIANIKITKIPQTIQQPIITISFDDGLKDTMIGASIMEKFNVVGTAFIDPATIDTDNFMSNDDVINLIFKGWDISGHKIGNLAKLSAPELHDHVNSTSDYLKDIGSPGYAQYALPNGIRSGAIMAELNSKFKYVFNINGMANSPTATLFSSINRHSIDKHTSLALAKKWVDDCVKYNEWTIINFHSFSNDWKNEEDWSEEDFTELLSYIKSKNVPIVPASVVIKNIDVPM